MTRALAAIAVLAARAVVAVSPRSALVRVPTELLGPPTTFHVGEVLAWRTLERRSVSGEACP